MSKEQPVYVPSEWGRKYHRTRADELFGAGAAGPGKALALDTIVNTNFGPKLMKDVHPGDKVLSMSGNPTRVLAESEVFTGRPCYKITVHYLQNESFICDENHLWILDTGRVLRTEDLYQMQQRIGRKPRLMGPERLEFAHLRTELPPQLLGYLFIRGLDNDPSTFDAEDIDAPYYPCKHQHDYVEEVRTGLYKLKDQAHIDYVREVFKPGSERTLPYNYIFNKSKVTKDVLRGIWSGCRGVPQKFEIDSPSAQSVQRLFDNLAIDGSVFNHTADKKQHFDKLGTRTFSSCVTRKRVNFPRITVEPCESVPTKCIQVAGDGSFVIGHSNVVTHNSMVLLFDPLQQIMIEHIRCQQDDKLIPAEWEEDSPGITQLIKDNPLSWGDSVGWVLQVMRLMPNHRQNIMRAQKAFPKIDPGVKWNEKEHYFRFSSGLRYEYGHVKDRNDHINYLSLEFTYIGFDELIKILETQYDAIRARLRTSDPVLKYFLRCCSMSNPRLAGNKGEDIVVDDPYWVKRRFVDPYPAGNVILKRTVTRKDGTTEPITRVYLPATLYDNPDKEFVRDYEKRLLSMPKHIRDCYLYGKWDGVIGSHFEEDWNPDIHVCEKFRIPADWPIFRACDWGFASMGTVGYFALSPNNTLYMFYEITFRKKDAEYVAKEILKPFEVRNKLWNHKKDESKLNASVGGGPCDNQLWEERGSSYKTKYQQMADNGIVWQKADKRSREANCQTFQERLRGHQGGTREPGIVFFSNCVNSTKTIPAMETDPNNLEQPKKGGSDHHYDMVTYACRFALSTDLRPPDYENDEPYETGDSEAWY
jgi:hypothetical protein